MALVDFALDPLPGPVLHRVLAEHRVQGPITPARFFGEPAWLIAQHAALVEALRDAERFPPPAMYRRSLEPVIGRSFISMDGAEHHRYRQLATPAFRSRAVERYERSELAALAHELVDAIDDSTDVDLVTAYSERLPYLVITRLLGMPRDREDEFHQWAIGLLRFAQDPANARRCVDELTRYLTPVVEARRREPREDVISELVHAEVDGRRLTDDEIHAHVRLLFPTGGETTHGALGNLLYALFTHEGLWEDLSRAPGAIPGAVEEALRWESSVAVLPRMSAPTPVTFHGVELPANSWVLFGLAAANRDPAVFTNPDRFDATRVCDDMLTFGPGHKSCPGMHLARKNLAVAVAVLIERFPRLHLIDLDDAEPRGVAPRGPLALRVRAVS